jgi:hypothetical protein
MKSDSLSELLASIYRRRLAIFLLVLGSLVGAEYYLQQVGTFWQARASLLVPGESTRMSLTSESESLPEGPVVPDLSEETRVGIMGLIHSNAVALRALENLGHANLQGPARMQALATLRRQVVADLNTDQMLVVAVTDRDRLRAARVANAFADALRQVMREMAERGPRTTVASLEKEAPLAWAAYASARRERLNFLEQSSSPDPEVDFALLAEEGQRLRTSLDELLVEAARVSAQLPIVEGAIAARPKEMQVYRQTLVENPAYTKALQDLSKYRVEVEVLKLKYRERFDEHGSPLPAHPTLESALVRYRQAQVRVEEEAEKGLALPLQSKPTGPMVHSATELRPDPQLQSLLGRLVDLQASEAGLEPTRKLLQEQLLQNEAAMGLLPSARNELSRLDIEIERQRVFASQITQRLEELRLILDQGLEFTFFEEHQQANPESATEVPKRSWVFFFAIAAALSCGLTLALGMELLARARLSRPW